MKAWIFASFSLVSTAIFGQTYAGLGFGVSSGAGVFVEHFVVPNWSLEANLGIPAVGFGVNRTLYKETEKVKSFMSMNGRKEKERTSGRVALGVNLNAGIIPDVGLFQYGFFNVSLHKVTRRIDYGMEVGWMVGNIVSGPPNSDYPQAFHWPGVQFTIGRSLFEPGPLRRLRQRSLGL